jgi:hypothetical protein
VLLLASSAITVAIFIVIRNAWAAHHFIFLWVPLILLFADLVAGLTPELMMIAMTGFLGLNLISTVILTQQSETVRSARERDVIFRYFSDDAIASQAIINFSSWGGYYIQSLYGPKDQLVTYTEPYGVESTRTTSLSPKDAKGLLQLSQQTGRQIYNVCFSELCNKVSLEALFGFELTFKDVLPGLPHWHVFVGTPRSKKK